MKEKIFSKPGQRQGLLYKFLISQYLYGSAMPKRQEMVLSVMKQTALNLLGDSRSLRPSKLHDWFKSYGIFATLVDFSYWWICIRKGVSIQAAQQVCVLFYIEKKYLSGFFFKTGSKQMLVRIKWLSKKCFAFVFFSSKDIHPQNL